MSSRLDADMSNSYQNQKEVGEGIKRAYKDVPGLKREDIFIVCDARIASRATHLLTKLLVDFQAVEQRAPTRSR